MRVVLVPCLLRLFFILHAGTRPSLKMLLSSFISVRWEQQQKLWTEACVTSIPMCSDLTATPVEWPAVDLIPSTVGNSSASCRGPSPHLVAWTITSNLLFRS